jgi:hypothetical protein
MRSLGLKCNDLEPPCTTGALLLPSLILAYCLPWFPEIINGILPRLALIQMNFHLSLAYVFVNYFPLNVQLKSRFIPHLLSD